MIFWGRLEDEKGIPELLKALQQIQISHPEILLHLIGEGNQTKRYREQADELGISDRVVFHGWIEPSKIRTLALRCWVGIFPSRTESFGLAVAEAMATGLPVIATTAGALPEIVENSKMGILIPPQSPSRLAKAILSLFDGKFDHAQRAERVQSSIQKKYSWEKSTDNLLSFYLKKGEDKI